MIQVYAENNTQYNKNGNITLIPIEAYTESELNGTWTATIVHPIDPEGRWEYLTEQAVVKMPSWNGDQLYRIVQRIKGDTEITCILYPIFFDSMNDCFLVDVRPTNKTGQEALNLMLAPNNKYSGTSNITATSTAYYEYKNFMEALNGEGDNAFTKRWGGEIEYDNFTVKVPLHLGTDNGLEMRSGKNIQSISEDIDMTGIVTRVYPKAYNGRKPSGYSYIDSQLINSYVTPKCAEITFDRIKLAADATTEDMSNPDIVVCSNQSQLDSALQTAVQKQFSLGIDKPVISISITGVFELSQLAGYENFSQPIGLGDTVHIIHSKLGITTNERIIYLKYNSILKRVDDIQIGSKPYDFFREVSQTVVDVDGGKYEQDLVVSVTWQWCLANSSVIPSGGTFADIQETAWQDTFPVYQQYMYYWMRSVNLYASGAVVYGDPFFDMSSQIGVEAEIAAATAQSAAETAQGIADTAQATADTKSKIFNSTPTTPYKVGDLFVNNSTGYVYICTTAKTASQSYSASDWVLYSSTATTNAQNTANSKRRIFTSTPTTPYDKSDLWIDNTNGYMYVCTTARASGNYASSDWTLYSSSATTAAQVLAASKKRVFMAQPTPPYDVGDIYFDGAHSNTYLCTTAKTASGSYAATDWTLYSTDVSNHFWYDSSGAHVSDVQGALTGNSQTIAANGTVMMRNGKLISSWSGTNQNTAAINFYDLTGATAATSNLIASYGSTGISQYVYGLLAMTLSASGMQIKGVDTVNQTSITEAIFSKDGVELYANNVLRLELNKTNGLRFFASDGTTVIASFLASEIQLGNNSKSAIIKFCQDVFQISAELDTTTKKTTSAVLKNATTYNSSDAATYGADIHIQAEHTQSGTTKKAGILLHASQYSNSSTMSLEANYIEVPAGSLYSWGNMLPTVQLFDTLGVATMAKGDENGDRITTTYAKANSVLPLGSASSDLNNETSSGLYAYSSSASNTPNNASGSLFVARRSSSYIYQVAFANHSSGSPTIFVRQYYSGSWSTWKTVSLA